MSSRGVYRSDAVLVAAARVRLEAWPFLVLAGGGPSLWAMRRSVALALVGLLAVGSVGCTDEASSPGTGAANEPTDVTLTTSVDADPAQLGDVILQAAGARDVVTPDQGAEERLTELGVTWCSTARASDVDNADATFRFSLNEFFGTWGRPSTGGEVQDVQLARALLAGEHASALAAASNDTLCPDITRR